jgi:hypothetical protein
MTGTCRKEYVSNISIQRFVESLDERRITSAVVRRKAEPACADLQRRARRHGRTEEGVRGIPATRIKNEGAPRIPLGHRLRERFVGIGIEDDLPELRGEIAQPATFKA